MFAEEGCNNTAEIYEKKELFKTLDLCILFHLMDNHKDGKHQIFVFKNTEKRRHKFRTSLIPLLKQKQYQTYIIGMLKSITKIKKAWFINIILLLICWRLNWWLNTKFSNRRLYKRNPLTVTNMNFLFGNSRLIQFCGSCTFESCINF